jgi:hypothetical protein
MPLNSHQCIDSTNAVGSHGLPVPLCEATRMAPENQVSHYEIARTMLMTPIRAKCMSETSTRVRPW